MNAKTEFTAAEKYAVQWLALCERHGKDPDEATHWAFEEKRVNLIGDALKALYWHALDQARVLHAIRGPESTYVTLEMAERDGTRWSVVASWPEDMTLRDRYCGPGATR